MFRRFALLALLLLAIPLPGASAQGSDAFVDVIDFDGPLDERAVDYMIDAITNSQADLVVLQLNSPGAVSGRIADLVDLVADPPVPVAAWVGPDPARAFGGAAQILAAAPIRAAAPGVQVGYLYPTVAGRTTPSAATIAGAFDEVPDALIDGATEVTAAIPGLVDELVPSIGQLVVGLDGRTVTIRGAEVTLATARLVEDAAGETGPEPAVQVRFDKGDLFTRTLRLAVRPEAAFFFLVAGIFLAAFEFYAAGAGLMAAVAVVSLLLSGYGLTTLPLRWWAIAATLIGTALLFSAFQRGAIGWRGLAGTAALTAGGLWFVDAGPQFGAVRWVVVLVVIGAILFLGIGTSTVVRARFSTATIGRDHLIGKVGTAAGDLSPDGEVTVDGARWRATGHRAAGIRSGDPVEVVAVSGIVLEVEPASARDDVRE